MTVATNRDSTSRFALRADLDADALRALDAVSEKATFRSGECFVLTGDPARTLLFLEYGRLMRRSDSFVLDLVPPLTLFGETGGSPSPIIRGEALESSCVWIIPRTALDSILNGRPLLAARMERIKRLLARTADVTASTEPAFA